MSLWKHLIAFLQDNPGSLIGLGTALVKGMDMLRKRAWDWFVMFSYVVAMPLGGHIGWRIGSSVGFSDPLLYIFTIFTAANVFVIVAAFTDHQVFEAVSSIIKRRLLGNGK